MGCDAATLRLATLPGARLLNDVALVGSGVALLAGTAQMSIAPPFTPAPTGVEASVATRQADKEAVKRWHGSL